MVQPPLPQQWPPTIIATTTPIATTGTNSSQIKQTKKQNPSKSNKPKSKTHHYKPIERDSMTWWMARCGDGTKARRRVMVRSLAAWCGGQWRGENGVVWWKRNRESDERTRRREREICVADGERDMYWEKREKVNEISKKNFDIDVRTVSHLRLYCSFMPKFLRFEIPDEDWFLVFVVPNAKYLTFGTPNNIFNIWHT